MKTLNKVKMSIWINALSAIVIGILFCKRQINARLKKILF